MVSRKRSLTMLQLAGFNPVYISSDIDSGERDCLSLFPVGYGDEYVEEESEHEEEIEIPQEAPPPAPEQVEESEEPAPAKEGDENDED